MKKEEIFEELLQECRKAYTAHPELMNFTPFPDDIRKQAMSSYHCSCSDFLRDEKSLQPEKFASLQNSIIAAGEIAHWRETYKDTDIGDDFMNRFGCYCIIGHNGPFISDHIRLFMVYMPAHLHYPWHHHPAEEIYMVVSGSAVFMMKDAEDKTLREGDTSFHSSNRPHAMETLDEPVLCLVVWRDQFEIAPVLTK